MRSARLDRIYASYTLAQSAIINPSSHIPYTKHNKLRTLRAQERPFGRQSCSVKISHADATSASAPSMAWTSPSGPAESTERAATGRRCLEPAKSSRAELSAAP